MNKKVLSWVMVVVLIILMGVVAVMLSPGQEQKPQAAAPQPGQPASAAPAASANAADAAPDSSIFTDGSMTIAQMTEKAGAAFGEGDFETCSRLFKELSVKAPSSDVWQGYFHCEYQRLGADFFKGDLKPETDKALREIAVKADGQSRYELDYLAMSIIWLMMRDREHCATSMEKMRDAMLQDPELTAEEQKQLVDETRALVEYIRDSHNSFAEIQAQLAKAIGF